MKSTSTNGCEAFGEASTPCRGAVSAVTLEGPEEGPAGRARVRLCRQHQQLFIPEEENETTQARLGWTGDSHMSYLVPEMLEAVAHRSTLSPAAAGYDRADAFAHLKKQRIDLEEAALTDKQLTAVCLVFYGGVKKKTAARAMKISTQALSDHIKAALKKIAETIG